MTDKNSSDIASSSKTPQTIGRKLPHTLYLPYLEKSFALFSNSIETLFDNSCLIRVLEDVAPLELEHSLFKKRYNQYLQTVAFSFELQDKNKEYQLRQIFRDYFKKFDSDEEDILDWFNIYCKQQDELFKPKIWYNDEPEIQGSYYVDINSD